MIRVYAFDWVPPFARGVVRDLRVRWALEEAGLDYESITIDHQDKNAADYRALQPFGQVPAYEEDGAEPVTLFESGAIVFHVAERSETLLPADPAGRAQAIQWMFAALNSIDPDVIALGDIDHFAAREPWAITRRPALVDSLVKRLEAVAADLGARDFLVEAFSAADILLIMTLRGLRHTDLVARVPRIDAYRRRCEARPAFQRALAAQMAAFARHTPEPRPA
jgi:glutathione S-transferase